MKNYPVGKELTGNGGDQSAEMCRPTIHKQVFSWHGSNKTIAIKLSIFLYDLDFRSNEK